MNNIIGIGVSFIYIFIVIGISILISKFAKENKELSRKTVHILVGNWVFITYLFDKLWAISFVPFVFIIINWISKKKQLIKSMERDDDSWGTVYYAISLLILSVASHLLKSKILLYSGILIMAYADGFAAIIGKKYAKKNEFLGIKGKSKIGSITVGVISFIISLLCLIVFNKEIAIINKILISIFAAGLASLTELIGKDGTDNLMLPIFSSTFLTLSVLNSTNGYYIYLFIIGIILVFSMIKNKLSVDGVVVAFLTGAALYSLGGKWISIALVAFFILGTLITMLKNKNKEIGAKGQDSDSQRNWKQVIQNSLPAVILTFFYYITGNKNLLLIAFSVFSAAAADTFASELGMLTNSKVYSILTFKEVNRGLSGGVSIQGFLFSFIGSFLLSLLSYPLFGIKGIVLSTILGFIGAIIDSILGAIIQRKYINSNGELQDRPIYNGQKNVKGLSFISNGDVNLMSLVFVVFLGILVINL